MSAFSKLSTALINIHLFFILICPENTDINVTCGTQYMDLSIYICPMYQALYNESLMVVNNQLTNSLCYGTADFTVTPPVLRFRFPINESSASACGNVYKVLPKAHSFNSYCLKNIFLWGQIVLFIYLFISGYKSGWKWSLCWLLKCPVCEHLWHREFHWPLCRCHHLSSSDYVQVFLQLPYAVPSQQHTDWGVSVLADLQDHN